MHHHRPLIPSLRRLPRHITPSQQRPRQRTCVAYQRPTAARMSSSTTHNPKKQSSLPASYYRGGTSRAIFFKQQDLPTNRDDWAAPFLGAIGSPDPAHGRQLDGLGGGISSLSKVCVVGPSSRDDADVDYTFAAIGVKDASVDYSSNCGNMSSAVGPFAVDSGMVRTSSGGGEEDGEVREVTVRIHNTNTSKLIHATFLVVDGEAVAHGDFAIDGVAGTAAPVRLDFIRPAGSRTGKLLPTGHVTDHFEGVRTTCIDVANPCCFVLASDLGVRGDISPLEMEEDLTLMGRLDRIRREVGVAMGLAGTVAEVPGSVPKIAVVSRPEGEGMGSGKGPSAVVARAMSVGQPHKAIPVTVALALAAAAKLPGSTVAECVVSGGGGDGAGGDGAGGLVIHHASGTLHVDAEYDAEGGLERATVFRTARRLMEGRVFWK